MHCSRLGHEFLHFLLFFDRLVGTRQAFELTLLLDFLHFLHFLLAPSGPCGALTPPGCKQPGGMTGSGAGAVWHMVG